ncbi:ABC transporter permease subunit [Streptomyces sp. 3MP-14]|uniref:ABC transporter permease subunit n=1 Tax=Streptomyces mimosae TaxID=2586635 RepID=A0A5N6A4G8_9ACTN|nr:MULTISPECIES: ABC transporter permease [Streptomyces]KAB8162869.1 ABC transporter permease subunit [Streptomyces mimosae]KAB8179082.1 ABC transporter permease subunit [Streptomyces sp. 3MP-14]
MADILDPTVTPAAPPRRAGHAARRAGTFATVLLSAYTLAFFLLYALPSDPVALMLERRSAGAGGSGPERIAALREAHGLDDPLLLRYLTTLGRLLTGDLGTSFQSGRPVPEVLAAVAPATLSLAAAALVLAVPFSVALALATSWRSEGLAHRLLTRLPALIAAIPAFWLGLLLLRLFSFTLGWVPSSGGEGLAGLVLPAVALALPVSAALTAVLVRSLDDMRQAPFVELLTARGLPWRRVYLAHVARNALLPFVTLAGLTVGGVLVGTVITETVFARAGLGRLLASSVETQDAPVILAITVLAALVFATVNLAVDLLYPLLDPRLRRENGGAPA